MIAVTKAQSDAPHYRNAGPASTQVCETCKFASGGDTCDKYKFEFEPGFTCDAWRPDVAAVRRRHQEIAAEAPMEAKAYAHGPGGLLSPAGLRSDAAGAMIMPNTLKRDIPSAARRRLADADFLYPDLRSFPIVEPEDVKAAVNAWGRASKVRAAGYTFEDFKRRLIRKARARGAEFVAQLPADWGAKKETIAPIQPVFTVYKDTSGQYRWLSISSTAYLDRDGEIVSTKALADDVARADADGDYGPLRFWHVPGWDVGDCDFNMMVGKALIEGGTWRRPEYAESFIGRPPAGISLGFRHPADEPGTEKVFNQIRRFERSLIPPGAMPSNRFTGFVTLKEGQEMATKIDTRKLAGLMNQFENKEEALAILMQAVGVDESAKAAGLQHAFKAAGDDYQPEPDSEAERFEYLSADELAKLDSARLTEYAGQMKAYEAAQSRQKSFREEWEEFVNFKVEQRLQAEKARQARPRRSASAAEEDAEGEDDMFARMGKMFARQSKELVEEALTPILTELKEIKANQLGRKKEVSEDRQTLATLKATTEKLGVELGYVQDDLAALTDEQPRATRRGYRASRDSRPVPDAGKERSKEQEPAAPAPTSTSDDPYGAFVAIAEKMNQGLPNGVSLAGTPIPDKGWGNTTA